VANIFRVPHVARERKRKILMFWCLNDKTTAVWFLVKDIKNEKAAWVATGTHHRDAVFV
jgi:hypothetical protein